MVGRVRSARASALSERMRTDEESAGGPGAVVREKVDARGTRADRTWPHLYREAAGHRGDANVQQEQGADLADAVHARERLEDLVHVRPDKLIKVGIAQPASKSMNPPLELGSLRGLGRSRLERHRSWRSSPSAESRVAAASPKEQRLSMARRNLLSSPVSFDPVWLVGWLNWSEPRRRTNQCGW